MGVAALEPLNLHALAPLVGSLLTSEDCEALTLAHRCFQRAHLHLERQIWSLQWWRGDLGHLLVDPGVWARKWAALARRMPGIKTLEVHVHDCALPEESARCLWRALPPSLEECIVVLVATDAVLAPFLATAAAAPLPRSVVFVLKFTEASAHGLSGCMLCRFLAALEPAKEGGRALAVDCVIETDGLTQDAWDAIAAAVPGGLVERVRCRQQSREARLTDACIASLARARWFQVTLDCYLDPEDPANLVAECARTLIDETATVCMNFTIGKFRYVSQRCKQLETYALAHASSDIALVNDGYTLQECMRALDASAVKNVRLCRNALLAPSVTTLLRQMARLRRRAELTVGIRVSPDDDLLHALCAELIRRYARGDGDDVVRVEIEHPDAQRVRRMTHSELLAELLKSSACVHDAWRMLKPPIVECESALKN